MNEGVVSKETVVLRRWGSSIQKFGFINGVDNVNWPPYRDICSPHGPTHSFLSSGRQDISLMNQNLRNDLHLRD